MASLTPKKLKGKTYYYARECQRVNGKPKVVRTTYLGTLERIISAVGQLESPPEPESVSVAEFGAVAALFDLAKTIGLVELVDKVIPKRRQGLSPGEYLLLAVLNRAIAPGSKSELAHWYQATSLPHLLPATPSQLSSQAFWNHMNAMEECHIEAIERELSQRLIERFDLSLRTLTYDGTNFFTYIDTQDAATLPQRGHNKQKHGDLRQVRLGMLVSTDFHIPLFHKVYQGNVTDATAFQSVSRELQTRYHELADSCEDVTLIFDKGNNSREAMDLLSDSNFHFVGSLVPSQHPDLLAIPLKEYQPLAGERLAGCKACRTQATIFGQQRQVVVVFNENMREGQLEGVWRDIRKTCEELRGLQNILERRRQGTLRGGRKPNESEVQQRVEKILKHRQWMKGLFICNVAVEEDFATLEFRVDHGTLGKLTETKLGKTILFTDRQDWSMEQIILAYRSQYHIESAFRDMKNPHYLGWAPMYHWTDSKIRVHAFTCVLALTLTSLLQRQLHQQGIDLSTQKLLDTLGGIKETLVIYPPAPGKKHPQASSCYSTLTAEQSRLFDVLKLDRYNRPKIA